MRWECLQCNYKNTNGRKNCKVCSTPKDQPKKIDPPKQVPMTNISPITVLYTMPTAPNALQTIYPALPPVPSQPLYPSLFPLLPPQSPPYNPHSQPNRPPPYSPPTSQHTIIIHCTHCKAPQGVAQPHFCHQCGTRFSNAVVYSSVFMM
jgi:hypothetical protein